MTYDVEHLRPADPADSVEYHRFMNMVPGLRERHPDERVAVCGGVVIARGATFNSLYDGPNQVTEFH